MYRNIAYLSRDQIMRLFTWDEEGNRVSYDVPYSPYYYMEPTGGQKGDNTSLYNTNLTKFEFPNEYRRRESIDRLKQQEQRKDQQDRGPVRLFESISTLQQFLVDRYWKENNSPDFSKNPIKFQFVDIETYSPDAFPNPDTANDTVNVITVYDSIDKHFYTWGLGEYTPSRTDVTYKNCPSERELLLSFVEFLQKD